jgi:hypothetical protein
LAWVGPLALVAAVGAGCSASPGKAGFASGGDAGPDGSNSVAADCLPLATVLEGDNMLPAGSAPLPRRLWRLSAEQWGNAVRDVLGLAQAPTLNNTGGTSDYAFFSDDSVGVDANFQFSIYQAVQGVITQITPQIPALAACKSGEAPQACAQRFAQTFGQKAFRRSLDPSEVTALLATYSVGAQQDFNTGIGLMIQALLQSPSFLYRTEFGPTVAPDSNGNLPPTTLTPMEVASQLSFLFANTIPDQALLDAAASGALGTPQGVAAQIDRLLSLDSVKQNIDRIVVDWFNIRQLFSKTKDPSFFSGLAAADQDQTALQSDVFTSAGLYVDSVLWAPGAKVNDLLTSQNVFVNQRLGQLYGLSAPGATATVFAAATDSNRFGMLTQPAFLWSMSDPTVTSIVKRGKFIHDDVICVDPGPGPGNILSDPAVQAKLAMLPTEIEKSDYRLSTQPCEGCHSQIDPYSRVLENFGPIGQYRTMADGVPVDPTANFSYPLPSGPITGAANFSKALVDNKLLTSCGVQKIASYMLGRMIRVRATCEIQQVHSDFQQTDGSISNLFRKVAAASFTRARSGGAQ